MRARHSWSGRAFWLGLLLAAVVAVVASLAPPPVTEAQTPPAPTNVQAEPSSGQVRLTWDTPDTTIRQWTIQWRQSTAAFWGAQATHRTGTGAFTVRSLSNNVEYDFRVRERVDDVDSDWSEIVSATPFPPFSWQATQTNLVYTSGAAITPVTLPAATGGLGSGSPTYSYTGTLPAGLSIDTGTRVLSGTPSAETATATITWQAEKQGNTTLTQQFTITVWDPFAWSAIQQPLTFVEDSAITPVVLPAAIGGAGTAAITYSFSGTLPPGLSINTGNRTLSGTPTTPAEAVTITWSAQKSGNTDINQSFTITIEQSLRLEASDITDSTATITLTGGPGNWWYRANTGPDSGQCRAVSSPSVTASLSGLSPGTTYTYISFSDSNCADAVVAAEPFTTTSLTASAITDEGATLTLGGTHTGAWHYQQVVSGGSPACVAVTSGRTATVSSLISGNSYTYRAFRESDCTVRLAEAGFQTLALDVLNLTDTTAVLRLRGSHIGSWHYRADKGPDAAPNCRTVGSGGTGSLSGLTAGTDYLYTIYRDALCQNQIVKPTRFTTLVFSLSAVSVRETAVTLRLTGFDGGWWYRASSGPDQASCTSVASGTYQVDRTGLTRGATYTYRAYSAAGCGAGDQLAIETFTTLALTISNITDTTATLTLSGTYDTVWHYRASAGPDTTCQTVNTGLTASLTGLSPTRPTSTPPSRA